MFENIEFPEPLWKRIILFFTPTQTYTTIEWEIFEGRHITYKLVTRMKVFRNKIYIQSIDRYDLDVRK